MKQVQTLCVNEWRVSHPAWFPLQDIQIHELPDGGSTENHYHDCHEYYIIVSGQADILLDNQRFFLHCGDVAAIYCGTRHHIEHAQGQFRYVALQDAPQGEKRPGRLPDPTTRTFVGTQGRYVDGPVIDSEIPRGHSAIVPPRTWFWLKQKPTWSFLTNLGYINFADGADEPDYHKHECDEIYLCTAGHMTALVGDVFYEMYEGDIIMIPTGVFHRITMAHGDAQLAYFYGELTGLHRYGHLEDGRDEWVL